MSVSQPPWFVVAGSVALGGAAGSVVRWAATAAVAAPTTPLATAAVNVVGCGGLGVMIALADVADPPAWVGGAAGTAVRFGLLGGLTTFSTFVGEAVVMSSRPAAAAGYVALNLAGGVATLCAAMAATRAWAA